MGNLHICKRGLGRLGQLFGALGRTDRKRQPTFIPPKKPYSLVIMLDDILEFSASTLVDKGRLSLWMPTANDDLEEFPIPTHPSLELVSVCIQPFSKC